MILFVVFLRNVEKVDSARINEHQCQLTFCGFFERYSGEMSLRKRHPLRNEESLRISSPKILKDPLEKVRPKDAEKRREPQAHRIRERSLVVLRNHRCAPLA